jgi:hypothetical protein
MKALAGCSIAIALAMLACILSDCTARPVAPEGNDLVGNDSCATCHEQDARYCRYGAHRTLACERCHGPGAKHAGADGSSRPEMSLGGPELCLSCHGQGAEPSSNVASRIESFEDHLREMERDHRIKLDRRKSGTDCVYCHDPHLLE